MTRTRTIRPFAQVRNMILALLIAATGLVVLAGPAPATTDTQVCSGQDSGKVNTTDEPMSVTVTAPAGQLIDGYCVKSGSSKNGNGPVYVTVDPPKQSVTIQYYSASEKKYKAISHYSLSYTTTTPPTEVCTYEWTRELPKYLEEYKWKQVVPKVEGVKEFQYKRKMVKTEHQYNKQTKTMVKHGAQGAWEIYSDWSWWGGNTPKWSFSDVEVLEEGQHGSWTKQHDSHVDEYDRDYRYVKTGVTRERASDEYEYVWATEQPEGWTKVGAAAWRWLVEPQPAKTIHYNDGDWTTDVLDAPWVQNGYRSTPDGTTTEGPVRSATEPDRGQHPDVPWEKDGDTKVCTVDKPTATPIDPCGPGNASWPAQTDTDEYTWSLQNGHLIVTTKPGYAFPGGATTHDFGVAQDSGEPCPQQETKVTPPAPPTTDGCAPGDVTWTWLAKAGDPDVVNDGAGFDWTYDAQAKTWSVEPQDNYYFPDDAQTVFHLPADEADTCDKVIETSPMVKTVDECGTENDEVIFDAETDDWTAVHDSATSTVVFTAKDGKVFEGSANTSDDGKTYTVTYTALTDEDCPPDVIPVSPELASSDECGTENDVFTYSPTNDYWTTTVNETSVVFEAKGDWEFAPGAKVSQDGKTWTETFTPNSDEECEIPDECLELPGIQPDGFECSKAPERGSDPWQGQPNCTDRTVSSGYTPWTRTWTHTPGENGGTWTLGPKAYGPTVITDTRQATVEECPPPASEPVSQSVSGCDLSAYGLEPGDWTRTGVRDYVLVDNQWELEDEADITWSDWAGMAWTPDEITANCAGDKPDAQVRTETGERESCRIGGVLTWTDEYTTDWVFNTDTQVWELGEETGPVRIAEELTRYTQEELEALGCVEVEGEQEEEPDQEIVDNGPNGQPTVEVKGEQAVAGAPGVPTAVDAGLGLDLGENDPLASRRNPLWLLAIGGGLGLVGTAGLRRRQTATR